MNNEDCKLLKNLLVKITDFSKKYSNILNRNSAPLWNYAKENYNVTLDSILFNDILLWLSYLGLNDGEISDEELKFINYILDTNFSKEDLLNHLSTNSIEDYENSLPTSFVVFHEFDRYVKNNKSGESGEIVESLFNIYGGIGQKFIDMEVDSGFGDDLKNAFDTYMANLRANINNLKRFNYDLMITSLNTELLDRIISSANLKTIPDSDFKIVSDDMYTDGYTFNTNYLEVLNDIFSTSSDSNNDLANDSNQNLNDNSLDKFKETLKNNSSLKLKDNEEFNGGGEKSNQSSQDHSNENNIILDESKDEVEDEIEDNVEEESLEDILAKLNSLVGLENVKRDVNSLINLIQIRKIREERGIKQPDMSLHLVFSGNPGTGKTTVARLLGEIYSKLGILSKGHLVETDRSGLVAGYVGQTAIKTHDKIKEAMGGILFIDEAYALSAAKGENDFGQEAIDTILKAMEDNREDFIVIVAGYPDLMDDFLHSNPGLESRFNKHIFFDDYNPQELFDIFVSMEEESSLKLDKKAEKFLKGHLEDAYECRGDNFANGRYVRNIFEKVLSNQADRLVNIEDLSDDELNTLFIDDFNDCFDY